jgi:O-antigen/teichoic acid export membrane protein
MLGYSLSTLLYTAGAVVLYQTMKFVATWRCGGPAAAGQMGLAISVAQTLAVVFTSATGVLQSRVGQLSGEGRLAEVPALLERSLVALGLLLVPSTVFLVLDAPAIFRAWVGGTDAEAALDSLVATTRLLLVGHGVHIAALPFYYALVGVGQHRVFGVGMCAVAVANSVLGWIASDAAPHIETLGAVYGILMLALVVGVTVPAGFRRFPIPLPRVLAQGMIVPLTASLPGALALAWRPRLGQPVVDLLFDGVLFALCSIPGLELARRRFGLPLRLGLRA